MKITEHVSYVGVQNPSMRVFDIIMTTNYGTSYNSYLVQGEKCALIETVHDAFSEEFFHNIENYIDVAAIDYVILNHTEPDHSGSLCKIVAANPQVEVIGTTAAIRNLANITNMEFKSRVIKQVTGEQLDLGGGVVLDFIVAPMLHWPDSMFTYLKADKVLFSCDVFGSHFCEPSVLDRYIKYPEAYASERLNYYTCIFSPFKKFVIAGMDKLKGLEIETACTSHGPVLQEKLKETMELYRAWSLEQPVEKKIAIFYVTAYGYTEIMARKFAEIFEAAGVKAELYNAIEHPQAELAAVMNEASAILFGSPTINKQALKPIMDLISGSDVVNNINKPALVFGSYGWSGEAPKQLTELLKVLKYKVFEEAVTCVFKPSDSDLSKVEEKAQEFLKMIEG